MGVRGVLLAVLAVVSVVVPVSTADADPAMCRPERGGGSGCIPSPMDCAGGRFNGDWVSARDGRRVALPLEY